MTCLLTQLLSVRKGISWTCQKELLDIVRFMCQLEKDMFEMEEDGITCNFEANGLEKTLTKLIERHN